MKIFIHIFIISLALPKISKAQAPEIEWENTIGANSSDALYSIKQTSDGGYIVGGCSNSEISGDKTEDNCGEFSLSADFWILKLNDAGVIQWQNTIGGTAEEERCFVFQTPAGDYIAAGSSASGKECEKTSNSYGGPDYWILKLNTYGVLLWQMKIGGESGDYLMDIKPTSDGGFILGGYSYKTIIGGNKTEAGIGLLDYFIVKISPTGTIEWQNTIGTIADDFLTSINPCADGGYIVAGYTTGGISGDKTEASMSPGYADYWILKLDNTGNIVWQNTIGGNFTDISNVILPTTDGGFLVSGYSDSGISGDKTESTLGSSRPWILKLNATGNIVWQNSINDGPNTVTDMIYTNDGNYLLTGGSFWLSKINPLGDEIWSQTIGSGYSPTLMQTADLGYIVGGNSNSGITDVKSEPNYGSNDYWVVKLAPDVCLPVTETCNSLDDNCNGLTDDSVVETITINAVGATTVCKGESVTLTATYSGSNVQWKKNGVNISGATAPTYTTDLAGNYTCLTTSDCGSAISEAITITTLKKPDAFIYADGPTVFCTGSNVTLVANTGGGLVYQWYKGASAIIGATSSTYIATTTGNYKCKVTKAASGCSKQSNAIAVSVTCKEDENATKSIVVAPNPASDIISVNTNETIEQTIIVYNNSGAKVMEQIGNASITTMDITKLSAGIYYLQITSASSSNTISFIKE